MSYADAGHRPHAIHTGETPRNPISYGPEAIRVTLDTWGPVDNCFPTLYDALVANWGESPSRTVEQDDSDVPPPIWRAQLGDMARRSGWTSLTAGQQRYVIAAFEGKTLPQALEMFTFVFTIDGVSRAFTHQNVRTRIGAAFMQHGGRDNDWRHRAWTMPETIRRVCDADRNYPDGKGTCITDWTPIHKLLERTPCFDGYESKPVYRDGVTGIDPTLESVILHYLAHGREIYAALVDAGIPWQDARRLLWMGTQTYIHDIYNFVAIKGMLANRLEHIMDWEHNCAAQLMVREINMKCPPMFGQYLQSHSDRIQRAAFAELESWPPDMKYDPNFPCECGHQKANHHDYNGALVCEVCHNDSDGRCTDFKAKDPLPRTHRTEQNPFFILHPDSMKGGSIVWIPTNGTYPEELRKR